MKHEKIAHEQNKNNVNRAAFIVFANMTNYISIERCRRRRRRRR